MISTLGDGAKEAGEAVGDIGKQAAKSGSQGVSGISKLASVLTSLNPIAIGVTAAIVIGVTAAIVAWDHFTTTVKETEEAIESINSRISKLNSEIEELKNIGYRNSEQNERLKLLEQELSIQERLLEVEEKRKAQEKTDNAVADWFDSDNYATQLAKEQGKQKNFNKGLITYLTSIIPGSSFITPIVSNILYDYIDNDQTDDVINKVEKAVKKYKKITAELNNDDLSSDEIIDKNREQQEAERDVLSATTELEEKVLQYQLAINDIQAMIDDGKIDKSTGNNLINQYTELYDKANEKLIEFQKTLGMFDYSENISKILSAQKFDGVKDKLVELGKAGKLSAENISNYINKDLIYALIAAGMKAEDLYYWIMNIADPEMAQRTKNKETVLGEIGKGKIGYTSGSRYFVDNLTDEELQAALDIVNDVNIDTSDWDIAYWKKKIEERLNSEDPVTAEVTLKTVMDQKAGIVDDSDDTVAQAIDNYKSKVSSLEEYLEKLNFGTYTTDDLLTLRTEFGLTGDSVDELKIQLEQLMDTELESIISCIDEIIDGYKDDPENASTVEALKLVKKELISVSNEAKNTESSIKRSGNALSNIQNLDSGMDMLKSIYQDISNGDEFDWSSIINNAEFEDTFKSCGKAYDNFIDSVKNNTDDINANKQVFNDLATAYYMTSGALYDLSEAEAEVVKQRMKDQGITNADEIVQAELLSQAIEKETESRLENAKSRKDGRSGVNSSIAGYNNEVKSIYQECDALKDATSAQKAYYLVKTQISSFDFISGDIEQLAAIVKALGLGSDAWDSYYNARNNISKVNYSVKDSIAEHNKKKDLESQARAEATASYAAWSKEIKDLSKTTTVNYSPKIDEGGGSKEDNDTSEKYDWLEKKIERTKEEVEDLDRTVNATYKSWSTRNAAIGEECEAIRKEIELQQLAYEKYMAAANAIELDQTYKDLVMYGGLDIETISDEELKKKISEFEELYNKAKNCVSAVKELNENIISLAKTRFNNIKAEFDGMIDQIDHEINMLDKEIQLVEIKGGIAGKSYYQAKIARTNEKMSKLQEEKAALESELSNAMASGIEEGSADYYELRNSINSVTEAIKDCEIEVAELEEKMKEIALLEFKDFQSQFGFATQHIDSGISRINKEIELVQARGKIAGTSYYKALLDTNAKKKEALQAEYDKLSEVFTNAWKNGDVNPGTENWNEMVKAWYEMKDEMDDLEIEAEELKNKLKEVATLEFDSIIEQFQRVFNAIDHNKNLIDLEIQTVEAKGKIAGTSFYKEQLNQNGLEQKALKEEKALLEKKMQKYLDDEILTKKDDEYLDLKEKLSELQEKLKQSKLDAVKIKEAMKDVAKLDFDDIASQFDKILQKINNQIDITDAVVGVIQASGHKVSKEYYKTLMKGENKNIDGLIKEKEKLIETRDKYVEDGVISKNDERYKEMTLQIQEMDKSILSATQKTIEYAKALRQIDWDIFDEGMDAIGDLNSESDFLINLLEYEKLIDKKGNYTAEGRATQALHVQKYGTYKAQSESYAKEIKKLDKEFEDDQSNTDYIARRKELVKLQQQSIINYQNEKKAAMDLVKEGLNAMAESLSEVINKYKEALNSAKDLYDYQNTIDEKSKNINSLQKQILAYSNDDSEETRAKLQQLSTDLVAAQKDLQETEYDRYIKDQTDMLDDFYEDFQDWMDERLENINEEFEELIAETNKNGVIEYETLGQLAALNGYSLSKEANEIWRNAENLDILTQTKNVNEGISKDIKKLAETDLDSYLSKYFGDNSSYISSLTSTSTNTKEMNSTIKSVDKSLSSIKSKVVEYDNNKELQTSEEIRDMLKGAKKSKIVEMSEHLKKQTEDYLYETDKYIAMVHSKVVEMGDDMNAVVWDLNKILECLGSQGLTKNPYTGRYSTYAKGGVVGGNSNALDLLAQALGEDHMIAAKEGERILTAEQNKNFEALASTGFSPIDSKIQEKFNLLSDAISSGILSGANIDFGNAGISIPNIASVSNAGNNTTTVGDVSITLPNVTNKQEFVSWLKTDGQIEKIIQSMTIGQMMGGNSYNKLKY